MTRGFLTEELLSGVLLTRGFLTEGLLTGGFLTRGFLTEGLALDRRAFDKGTSDRRVSQELPVDSYPVLDDIINQSV